MAAPSAPARERSLEGRSLEGQSLEGAGSLERGGSRSGSLERGGSLEERAGELRPLAGELAPSELAPSAPLGGFEAALPEGAPTFGELPPDIGLGGAPAVRAARRLVRPLPLGPEGWRAAVIASEVLAPPLALRRSSWPGSLSA